MNQPDLKTLRNIGIISHIDAGKTTVSERILYYTGEIHKMGEVHEGSATMDWMDQEQERGITITATSNCCRWKDLWINLIDTPGHIDFTIEVERSLRVLDGAIAIFSAVEGVQPQSESVWRQSDRYRVPRICLINKLDRIGSDYQAVLEQMRKQLDAEPVLLQLPIGSEGEFKGVIDLLTEEALIFSEEDQGRSLTTGPIPDDMVEDARKGREAIVEAVAELDDSILCDYLEGNPVSAERIKSALRQGTVACRLFPVLLGSALRNKGVQPLLDAVADFLPAPLDLPPVQAFRPGQEDEELLLACDPSGPLCAMAFKVLSDEGRKLTYLRIYSGTMKAGEDLHNSNRACNEKVARLFRMHAHKRERLTEAKAGDIVAATGLKSALTGDTLCRTQEPLILSGLTFADPVVSLAVEPKSVEDRNKLWPSLEKLQWEDPTFRVREDEDTGQTILSGMGELHLEVVVNRLEREFNVHLITGRPQVVYRETVQKAVEHRETFYREVEGKVHSGEICLRLQPGQRGSGIAISWPERESSPLPQELQLLVVESLEQGCAAGVLAGYALTDTEVVVLDVPFDPGHTTEIGIRAAAQRGLALAARSGMPTLLEPIMALELITPTEQAGKVLGSLQQKGGKVQGISPQGEMEVIRASVPLSALFGYMTELRSATRGRGTFTMEFSHFDQAPVEVLQRFGVT